jgi:hypothetical protein
MDQPQTGGPYNRRRCPIAIYSMRDGLRDNFPTSRMGNVSPEDRVARALTVVSVAQSR